MAYARLGLYRQMLRLADRQFSVEGNQGTFKQYITKKWKLNMGLGETEAQKEYKTAELYFYHRTSLQHHKEMVVKHRVGKKYNKENYEAQANKVGFKLPSKAAPPSTAI
mmetsp:Transcript_22604/g.25168  ORF Transcript_22604/g.25168 Transcript_22604/m.25168 type:complete len:109 (-) Transcript_22604:18-344(-)